MITRVISGGQTGADQAGLRAAKALGLATGGWVPRGCRTEDGRAPWLLTDYGCQEHASPQYAPRTVANVREADCLIWFGDPSSPGGRLTRRVAMSGLLPALYVPYPSPAADDSATEIADVRQFLRECAPAVVMIAGNRESTNPGIGACVEAVLRAALRSAVPQL